MPVGLRPGKKKKKISTQHYPLPKGPRAAQRGKLSIYNFVCLAAMVLNVDVLICGGGMSGMACATFASEAGAKVLLVEKQASLGGSSNYSAGML